mmetsp:Transcript_27366/g.49709  ORF Transcript_27366/g.49709 Transcript_27366/m.49709 type:complete len:256 (-) Transcript_27366:179-946(-)
MVGYVRYALIVSAAAVLPYTAMSFSTRGTLGPFGVATNVAFRQESAQRVSPLFMVPKKGSTLVKIPDEDDVPIPFIDTAGSTGFIECYADSIATIDGMRYTIAVPCDYSVAICYFEEDGGFVPIELDDELMDEVFGIAESIVEEEFGEELSLQRTPQTLTLMGELEEDEEEDTEEEDDDDTDTGDGEESVEVLLQFEHKGTEYNLVRLLDPVLLVGRDDPSMSDRRILLTNEESDAVMPELEELFLAYQEERDSM